MGYAANDNAYVPPRKVATLDVAETYRIQSALLIGVGMCMILMASVNLSAPFLPETQRPLMWSLVAAMVPPGVACAYVGLPNVGRLKVDVAKHVACVIAPFAVLGVALVLMSGAAAPVGLVFLAMPCAVLAAGAYVARVAWRADH